VRGERRGERRREGDTTVRGRGAPLLEVAHQQPQRLRDEVAMLVEGEVHQHVHQVAQPRPLQLQDAEGRREDVVPLLSHPDDVLVLGRLRRCAISPAEVEDGGAPAAVAALQRCDEARGSGGLLRRADHGARAISPRERGSRCFDEARGVLVLQLLVPACGGNDAGHTVGRSREGERGREREREGERGRERAMALAQAQADVSGRAAACRMPPLPNGGRRRRLHLRSDLICPLICAGVTRSLVCSTSSTAAVAPSLSFSSVRSLSEPLGVSRLLSSDLVLPPPPSRDLALPPTLGASDDLRAIKTAA